MIQLIFLIVFNVFFFFKIRREEGRPKDVGVNRSSFLNVWVGIWLGVSFSFFFFLRGKENWLALDKSPGTLEKSIHVYSSKHIF